MVATRRGRKSSDASASSEPGKGDDNNSEKKIVQSPKRRSSRLRSASHDSPLTTTPPGTTTSRRSAKSKLTDDAMLDKGKKQSLSAKKNDSLPKRKVGRPRSKSVPSTLEAALNEEADKVVEDVVASTKESAKEPTTNMTSSRPKRSRSLSKDVSVTEVKGRKRSASVASASSLGSTKAKKVGPATSTIKRSKATPNEKEPPKAVTLKGMEDEGTDKKKTTPLVVSLTAISKSKIATISAEKIKDRMQKKKSPRNELTNFIPGYTAALRLDSSSLNNQRPGLESLRRRALTTDKSTAAFMKGTVANRQQTKAIVSSKEVSSSSSSSAILSSSFKKGTKREAPNHAGDKWFGMVPTPLTDDVKRDLNVIRSRNYLDPKRFYKSSDKAGKFIQVGTVIEGNTEFNSSRLTKKQRRANLTEELMADPATADYAQRKYKKMQQAKSATYKKQNNFKKRGKRQHF